jgi:ubiquinone/menaquinone biosynthesis C-methylase UbiE
VLNVLPDADSLDALMKALAEPMRMRILGLLAGHELSVGELSRALGSSQSRVSNHLRVLRKFALLGERHVGPSTFLSLREVGRDETSFEGRIWQALSPELARLPEHAEDLARLRVVLDERRRSSRDFFDRVAGEWETIGIDFATGQARQRVVASFLSPELVIADLGCGTGYIAQAFGGLCRKVIAVDRSEGMLVEARARLIAAPTETEYELRRGELDALPIADDEVDGAVCAMVLHHLEDPAPCLSEMFRSIRPGGRAVVLELAPHREEWMHEQLGDSHLGLDSSFVAQRMREAGFADVHLELVEDGYQPAPRSAGSEDSPPCKSGGLPLYLVRGRVPQA